MVLPSDLFTLEVPSESPGTPNPVILCFGGKSLGAMSPYALVGGGPIIEEGKTL